MLNHLRKQIASIFGWAPELLSGVISRSWRETPDPKLSKLFGRPITPRQVMQQVGTDLFRQHFHIDTWLHAWRQRAEKAFDEGVEIIFVPDVRFPNEVCLIQGGEFRGKVFRVVRPQMNKINESNHSTEQALKDFILPVIENDNNRQVLREKLSSLVFDFKIRDRTEENTDV